MHSTDKSQRKATFLQECIYCLFGPDHRRDPTTGSMWCSPPLPLGGWATQPTLTRTSSLADPRSPQSSTPVQANPRTRTMTEALFFNSHSGYLEGVLRGFKAGLLTQAQYSNLTQCESLDDFKMQLTATDYGNFLANETPPISTSTIAERATQRMVDEFNYIRSNATGNLKKFLDYMTCVPSGGGGDDTLQRERY